MKLISIIALTLFGVFGIWKFLIARKPVALINLPIATDASPIMEQCIAKLNAKGKICLNDYKGKKLLLVNVASECGYTKQYTDLEKLYTTYRDKLVIIGFPCNQFGGQEPGTEEEIEKFCSSKYMVTFPITSKIAVKDSNQHPIYKWLTTKSLNGVADYQVRWNFNKFMLDENGQLIGYFNSKINPLDSAITNLLK
ncbi:MAG: glutathione peroxidase [Bacteroidia bacterium]